MAPDPVRRTVTTSGASVTLQSRQYDDGRFMQHLRLAAILLGLVVTFGVATAADMRSPSPPVAATEIARQASLKSYIQRRAVLLLIRAAFDVIADEDISPLLADDARRLAATGPTVEDEQALDADLLSEGSHVIVSLRYLIAAGGAAWPPDRLATSYAFDAEVLLESLQADLLAAASNGADPLPILQAAERIHWQTEGFATSPPESDRFRARDDLVEQALASAPARSST